MRARVGDGDDGVIVLDANRAQNDDDSRVEDSDDDGSMETPGTRGAMTVMILDAHRARAVVDEAGRVREETNGGLEERRARSAAATTSADARSRERTREDGRRNDEEEEDETMMEGQKRSRESVEAEEVVDGLRKRVAARRAAETRERDDDDDDGFEISDGDVSEHSESSQDRTRGVKSFKVSDVANERFGKGKRGLVRRTVAGRTVEDVLRERPMFSDEDEARVDEDDDGRSESSPGRVEMRESQSESDVRDASSPRRVVAAPLVELSPSEVIARASPGRRTHTFGEINKTFLGEASRDQPRITSVFSKAPAPWNFDHRAFGDATSSHPSTSMNDVVVDDDDDVTRACAVEDVDHEGSRALETLVREFIASRSVGRVGARVGESGVADADVGAWRRAMASLERGRGFWAALGRILRQVVDEEFDACRRSMRTSPQTPLENGAHARALETAWELVFVAAKLWHTERHRRDGDGEDGWGVQAWALVGWVLDECRFTSLPAARRAAPATFDGAAYAAAVCERIAELVARWPRCLADKHPVRVLWTRLHGAVDEADAEKTTRAPSPCCSACMPLAWRPYEATFEAANARFVSGAPCESLYRALGDHLAKCSVELKVFRRELGKWSNDARLSKVADAPAAASLGVNACAFRALGGHAFPMSAAVVRLQHRASVYVELFRACVRFGLEDQAVLFLKRALAALAAQPPASDDPAARCALLRATTTCLGIWLARGATTGTWGRVQPRDEALRIMRALADSAKTTGSAEASEPGTARALDEGAVVAEASAAWSTAYAVCVAADPESAREALETMGSLEARASASDWRDRVFAARSLATLYAPDSFASRYGLADVKTGACLWLSFAVDPVAGGAGPLAVALCARGDASIMNQEASSAAAVGWAQSNGGGAVASALVGKTNRGRDSHVAACGDRPGAHAQTKECDFRVAVAALAAKELSEAFRKGDDVLGATLRRLCLELPSHCVRAHKQRLRSVDGRHADAVTDEYARVASAVVGEIVARCSTALCLADCAASARLADVRSMSHAIARLVPFPPSAIPVWGSHGAEDSRSRLGRLGDAVAARLESRARLVFREQLIAIDAAMNTTSKTSNANASTALRRQLAVVTCGALEAVTGSPTLKTRERALVRALAGAMRGRDQKPMNGAAEIALKEFLPHFILSALKTPQKCAARRMITSARFVSALMRVDGGDEDDEEGERVVAPSLVLSVTALPLVVVAHETMSRTMSSDHHAVAGVEAVLTDVLIPLLAGRFSVESKPPPPPPTTVSATSSTAKRARAPTPAFPKPQPLTSNRAHFPFPGDAGRRSAERSHGDATVHAPASRPASPALPIVEATGKEKSQANIFRVALKSNAVWRIIRAYVSVSVMSLARAALATPAARETTDRSSAFQAISKKHERSLREAEIERMREVLKAAIKSSEKALSTERREAERALSDALAPFSAAAVAHDDDASYDLGPRWGDAESAKTLTPSAFFVEENASERERTLLIAATRFLTQCAKSSDAQGFAEVSARTSQIQAAVTFLLEPGSHHNATNASKHSHFTSALRALSQTLGDRAELPKRDAPSGGARASRR